ncbi:MAG: oligoendopeptidase F family protein [Burkholderiales bacterium]|nr:oligoendopeptidase F family protein [Burkholderiales bacterium]
MSLSSSPFEPVARCVPARVAAFVGVALVLQGLAATALHAQAPAGEPRDSRAESLREIWDLTRLFPDDAAWEAERQAIRAELPALRALQGSLTSAAEAKALLGVLERQSALQRRMQKLWVFASTQISTDNRERRNQERSALANALWGEAGSATAWIDPAIQALGRERIEALQRAEPGLARHARRLANVLRLAAHRLSAETEAALAAQAPLLGVASEARSMLVASDIEWPQLVVDGRPVRVSDTGYQQLREHPDRAVRQQAFEQFFKTYAQFEGTFGTLLAQRVQSGVINARLRHYPSAVAASLAPSEVPEAILRTLVAEVNAGLPALHRYFRLRQRLLRLPDLHYHDVYPDMVQSTRRYDITESGAITLAALQPLGEEVQGLLKLALSARTMHVRPAAGKRSGAYQTGVYGEPPFVFLNHQDTYGSLSTFAHEWGHGLHTMLAQRAQPFETAGYPLFLAEIASMTKEVLLNHHMLARAGSKEERLFVLGRVLEEIRGGFFRQAMFAEFELQAHDAVQRGEAMSGKRFTQIYCDLLRRYHGSGQGVLQIDPKVCTEWAFISHFHRPFYVYAYATSITAAFHFGEQIAAGRPGVRDAYLGVLRAGSSVPPHELLVRAGLDLTSPAPYRSLVRRMNEVMDEMERLLD